MLEEEEEEFNQPGQFLHLTIVVSCIDALQCLQQCTKAAHLVQ